MTLWSPFHNPRAPISEAYRSLRTNIQFASVDKPIQSLLITSIAPSEGKTTVAANLSITLAQGGRNVILIDADLRKPKLHRRMNLPNRKGLTSLFMQPELQLDGTVQKTDTNNLYVMTAGNLPPNPSELLASDRMDLYHLKYERTCRYHHHRHPSHHGCHRCSRSQPAGRWCPGGDQGRQHQNSRRPTNRQPAPPAQRQCPRHRSQPRPHPGITLLLFQPLLLLPGILR